MDQIYLAHLFPKEHLDLIKKLLPSLSVLDAVDANSDLSANCSSASRSTLLCCKVALKKMNVTNQAEAKSDLCRRRDGYWLLNDWASALGTDLLIGKQQSE